MEVNTETYNFWSLILQLIVAVGAITFGVMQTSINRRMKQLQDYVAVSTVYQAEDDKSGRIMINNIGKINLYLFKFEFIRETTNFEDGNLIAVGDDDAKYGIDLNLTRVEKDKRHTLKLYLKDSGGRKYISTHTLLKRNLADGKASVYMTTFAPKRYEWNY